MISPNNILLPLIKYTYVTNVTYSYKEGVLDIIPIIIVASIIALISMMVSLIIGIRKKDCLTIFVTNIMVQTVAIGLLFLLSLNDFLLELLDEIYQYRYIILYFIASVVIEGLIYRKILKNKKYKGMTVSIICNIGTLVITILMFLIFGSEIRKLLNWLF